MKVSTAWPTLLALALGGFALGLTEFVTTGLLPEIARVAVTPGEHVDGAALDHAGWSVSAYAAGVVVGAPVFAIVFARTPLRRLVLGLLLALAVGNVASAIAPSLPLLLGARFLAGLPHGAYFGVAGLLAGNALGGNARGRGFAVVLSGLTIANVVGVPVITLVGQASSWRIAYGLIAVLFMLAAIAVRVTVAPTGPRSTSSPSAEFSAVRTAAVWLAVSAAAIGFAGFFAVDSYIAPITTRSVGLPPSTVPWVLATAGVGMTVGNLLGGVSADRYPRGSTIVGLTGLCLSMATFAVFARSEVGLFVTTFLVGACSLYLAPALQAGLIRAAPHAILIGPALNQSAMNVANGVGAFAGGAVIAGGLPYTATGWVGSALAGIGLMISGLSVLRTGGAKRPKTDTETTATVS